MTENEILEMIDSIRRMLADQLIAAQTEADRQFVEAVCHE